MTDTERRLAAALAEWWASQCDDLEDAEFVRNAPETAEAGREYAAALLPVVAEIEAEARAGALRDARDDLYAGYGPDFAADSDIVYGEWLGNRADSIARTAEGDE